MRRFLAEAANGSRATHWKLSAEHSSRVGFHAGRRLVLASGDCSASLAAICIVWANLCDFVSKKQIPEEVQEERKIGCRVGPADGIPIPQSTQPQFVARGTYSPGLVWRSFPSLHIFKATSTDWAVAINRTWDSSHEHTCTCSQLLLPIVCYSHDQAKRWSHLSILKPFFLAYFGKFATAALRSRKHLLPSTPFSRFTNNYCLHRFFAARISPNHNTTVN
jgi:hypothetical protein